MVTDALQIAKDLSSSIHWLLRQQNRDGSWGKTPTEKVRWTSNIVISLHEIMDAIEGSALERAIKFLESDAPERSDEWFLRIPAFLSVDRTKLMEKDLGRLEQKIAELDLFYQAALLLQISDHRFNDVRKTLLASISNRKPSGEHGIITFDERWNQSTLYALFVIQYSEDDDLKKSAHKVIAGVSIVGKQPRTDQSGVCFSTSNSISGYVGLNLLEYLRVHRSASHLQESFFYDLYKGFKRKNDGSLYGDKEGLQAFASRSRIYTTSIFIRFVSKFLSTFNAVQNAAFRNLLAIVYTYHSTHQLVRAKRIIQFSMIGLSAVYVVLLVLGKATFWEAVIGSIPGVVVALAALLFSIAVERTKILG
ncbi:MAG: hypothetical protein MN733_16595 [Nitrososphaera sp.]|nr:hypothetical protein [Nitrososphaera sp.]